MFRQFKFEQDFYDKLRCIPFSTRMKLDLSRVKLSLKSWNLFSEEERQKFCQMPVNSEEQALRYREALVDLLGKWEEPVKLLDKAALDAEKTQWGDLGRIPVDLVLKLSQLGLSLSLGEWGKMDDLQRFTLFKLSQGKHDHVNLGPALQEFLTPVDF